MITDPRFAPRRGDLPYLRRRSRRTLRAAAAAAAPRPAPRAPAAGNENPPEVAVTEFFSGRRPPRERAGHPPAPPPSPPPERRPSPSAPPGRPAPVSGSLDLDGPAPAAPAPIVFARRQPAAPAAPHRPPGPVSSSLDLDAPSTTGTVPAAAPARPASAASTSLDLDAAQPPAPRAATPTSAPQPALVRTQPVARVTAGGRTILSHKSPTVTLTRTQSGIGTLTIEAACSSEVGDLRLGCAYQLRSGLSSTMQVTGGSRLAPPRSRRPILVGGHDRYERISVDLRQCRDLERLAVYAFSESRAQLNWGGTLIATTFGGAKIELPLEQLAPGGVAVLLSLYNVRGEFVLRSEMETISGSIREACRAYGYDQITWLDDRTPVD